MSVSELGVGLLGWGSIAQLHADALQQASGARLVAVGRRDLTRPETLPDDVAGVAGLEGLLARDDVDVVAVTTPSGQHAHQAAAALDAGRHVVIEKPVALRVADAAEVLAASQRSGRVASVIFQRRFEPAVTHVRELVQSGALGRPLLGEAVLRWRREPGYYASGVWRGTISMDGGVLMNQAIHVVDLLRWLLGPVDEVAGRLATRVHDIEAEDTAAATLRFASGALGVIAATTGAAPGVPGELTLTFEHGIVSLTEAGIVRWEIPDIPRPDLAAGGGTGAADPTAIGVDSHLAQWRDIIDAIAQGRPPAVDVEEGTYAVAVIEAVYEGHAAGAWVRPRAISRYAD